MKDKFFPFIRPTEQELKELWSTSIFTFDANILLNFYRYKTETTSTFFGLLNKLKERSFITYQACEEYFSNRLDVISEQEKAYSQVSSALQSSIEDPLHNQRKHPYISPELLEELSTVANKVREELNARSKEYSQRISQDDILDRIVTIFDNKVGNPFSEERITELYQEGDKRYAESIPPGFKDKSKGGIRQFGDLVLWFQIIELAKQEDKDVVFISDDEKEDWVQIHKGRTIGLLPELQKEFHSATGKKIILYNASRFIELASDFLNTQVSEETIEDVRSLQAEIISIDYNLLEDEEKPLSDEEINEHLLNAVHAVKGENGWAELAPLGFYLIRRTPVNYRGLGFSSLSRFIESRDLFEIKALQKSPNAKKADTAYVRLKAAE